jgi:hypothetical protein
VPSSGIVTWKSDRDLQQQPLDLDVGLVDLVDQQHGRLVARIAVSSGRVSRNSSVKMSSWVCSHSWSPAAWIRSSCFL